MGNLLLDASSPAIVWNSAGTTAASGSFTPPAGSLLIAAWSGNTGLGSSPATPSITGGGLTWTLLGHSARPDTPATDGQAAIWWATVPSSAAMTVAVTNGEAVNGGAIKVWVWTDDGGGTPTAGAAVENGRNTSGTSVSDSVTATANGSRGMIVWTDWNATAGTATAGTGCTLTGGGAANQGALAYAFALRTTADGVNGAALTLNLTTPSTDTNRWVIAEAVPAATAAAPQIGYTSPAAWPGNGPMFLERLLPDPASADPAPASADVQTSAEATTHDLTAGGVSPAVGGMDGPSPAAAHTSGDPAPGLAGMDGASPTNGHTSADPSPALGAADQAAAAPDHQAGPASPSLAAADQTASAVTHTANDAATSTVNTVNADAGPAAAAHTAGDPAPALAAADTTAPAAAHTTGPSAAALAVPAGDGAIGHTTGDPTVTATGSAANADAGAAAADHQAGQAGGGLGNSTQAAQDAHNAHDPSTTLGTAPGSASAAHDALDAGFSTFDPSMPRTTLDTGLAWAGTADGTADGTPHPDGTTLGALPDGQATPATADGRTTPAGLPG